VGKPPRSKMTGRHEEGQEGKNKKAGKRGGVRTFRKKLPGPAILDANLKKQGKEGKENPLKMQAGGVRIKL